MSSKSLLNSIRNYKFQSIFIKSLLMIIMLVLIPFAVMCLVIYNNWSNLTNEEISSISLNSLNRVRDTVDQIFGDTDLMATKISLRNDVEYFLLTGDANQLTNNQLREINNTINIFAHVYQYIDSIYVYSEESKTMFSNRFTGLLQVSDDYTWYEEYQQRIDNQPFALARKRGDVYPYFVSMIRPANIFQNEKLGAVVININMEELGKIVGKNKGDLLKN